MTLETIKEFAAKMELPVNVPRTAKLFIKYQEKISRGEMIEAWGEHVGLYPYQCYFGKGCLEDKQEDRKELNFEDSL